MIVGALDATEKLPMSKIKHIQHLFGHTYNTVKLKLYRPVQLDFGRKREPLYRALGPHKHETNPQKYFCSYHVSL
jgi:hypothetical protein